MPAGLLALWSLNALLFIVLMVFIIGLAMFWFYKNKTGGAVGTAGREGPGEYRRVFNGIKDALLVTDENFNIRNFNPAFLNMFGYQDDEIIGSSTRIIYRDENVFRKHGKHLKDQRGVESAKFSETVTLVRNDGTEFPGEIRVFYDYNAQGEVTGYIGLIQDVTEKVRLRNKFKQTQSRLKRAERVAEFGHWEFDPSMETFEMSEGAVLLFGLSYKEVYDYGEIEQLILEPYREEMGQALNIIVREWGSYETEFKMAKADTGDIRDLFVSAIFDHEKSRIFGIIQDVTDRKRMEEALIQSKEQMSVQFSNLPGMAYRCQNDISWPMEFVSEGCAGLTGYDADVLMDRDKVDFGDLIHPDDQDEVWKEVQEALKEKSHFELEYRIIDKEGHEKWVWERGNGIFSEYGELEAIEGFISDITDRKKAEKRLAEERILLRTVIDNLPDAIYAKDLNYRKILTNKADLHNIGKSEDEVIGQTDAETFPRWMAKQFMEDDHKVIEEGEIVLNREEQLVNEEGESRWLMTSKLPLRNQRDQIIGLVGIGRDITDRKKAEMELKKLSKGIEQSPVMVVITDTDGFIEYVNPKFEEIIGYSRDEVEGRKAGFLESDVDESQGYGDLWETINRGRVWKGEFINKKKDGATFPVSATISPVKDENGEITHFISVEEDITQQRRNKMELEKSLEEKMVLLAEIHHRVKNNLAIISGLVGLQMEKYPNLSEVLRDTQNRIHSIAGVHELLYNTENFAGIELDKYIEKLAGEIAATYTAENKKVDFRTSIDPIILNVNQAVPLGLLINELINNSYKHAFNNGSTGEIALDVSKQKDEISVAYSDNGIGFRDSKDDNGKTGEKTLGLELIQTLSAQLDAYDVAVDSEDGFEYTFCFKKASINTAGSSATTYT